MNKSDAAELLAFAAAYDQRTIGNADVEAWALALADIPWDDTTRTAVAGFYTQPAPTYDPTGAFGRRSIQPHHVRAGRVAIRNDRIARLPQPCPNPVYGVTEQEELLAIRAAIADGHITTTAQLHAYERWGGSLHLARHTGQLPALDGPEPAKGRPLELDVFQRIPTR